MTTTSMSTASMENKKAKRAPCKRVRENENLDSTSGLVQQHASGSCSPKIPCLTNSETCTAVQLPTQTILVAPPTTMDAKNA